MTWLFGAMIGFAFGFGTSEKGAKIGFLLGAVFCLLMAANEQQRPIPGYYKSPEIGEVTTLDYEVRR